MDATPSRRGAVDEYAAAMLAVARAEGDPDGIADQLFRIAAGFDASEPLRQALTDTRIPIDRKQAIIDELLGSRASKATVALVNLLVGSGRIDEFGAIARRTSEMAAEGEEQTFAEIRSAMELDDAAVSRIEERLSAATGRRVRAKVVVDPKVLGGVVAKVGDTVFDGSVRSRLEELREAWG